jgi:predicted transcriptional regulator
MIMIINATIDQRVLEQALGTVADAMRADVLVLDIDTPADVAARRLERAGISGAPVARGGHVVGVVTLRDLFAAVAIDERARRTTGPFLRREHELATYRVGELMTHQPAVARARWPLIRAVAFMVEMGVNRLPVVDDNGRAVGILARDDILRAVAAHARRPAGPRLLPD